MTTSLVLEDEYNLYDIMYFNMKGSDSVFDLTKVVLTISKSLPNAFTKLTELRSKEISKRLNKLKQLDAKRKENL